MPLTISEIVERAGQASNPRFIDRLRYWTREKLLVPTGKPSPGKGKHYGYPETAVKDALILNKMMEAGVPIAGQKFIMGILRQERHLWQLHPAKMPKAFYLVIEEYDGGFGHPYYHTGEDFKIKEFAGHTTIFNLTKLFAPVATSRKEVNNG